MVNTRCKQAKRGVPKVSTFNFYSFHCSHNELKSHLAAECRVEVDTMNAGIVLHEYEFL